MSAMERIGLVPVGRIDKLPPLEATLIRCLRLFYESDEARGALARALAKQMGARAGDAQLGSLTELLELLRQNARRPLMRRHSGCGAVGADECAFATLCATAATGEREDALLIAVCLVRADLAPAVVALAAQVGLGLRPLVPEPEARRLH